MKSTVVKPLNPTSKPQGTLDLRAVTRDLNFSGIDAFVITLG